MATQLNTPFRPNKPTTPQKPNGIAHMTNDVVGDSERDLSVDLKDKPSD